MSDFSVLAVGDHFIPGHLYADALSDLSLEVDVVALGGSKEAQHHDQQIMEVEGPHAVMADHRLVDEMRSHDLVIVHFAPVPLAAFVDSSVKGVFAARTGVENIDVDAATSAGAGVFNVFGRNASAVAELALGLMLSEARNISRADYSIKDGGWRKDFTHTPAEIGGSTVGLVGYGHVGREIARRLQGFDVRLLVADPFVDQSVVGEYGGQTVSIEELFATADFVSLQARLTNTTKEMIDARLIGLMKPTAYLINVARSRLVNTEDLITALEDDRIAGAGIDVYDEEPLPIDSRLRLLDNVTLTTHFGGDTRTTNERSAKLVADRVKNFIEQQHLDAAVNADSLGWV